MKIRITPIILIIISLIFIGLGRIEKFDILRIKIASVFFPVQKIISLFFNISKGIKEQSVLKKKIAELTLENQLLKKYKLENDEFRDILNFAKDSEYELILSKIIMRENEPFPSLCIIDKGRQDGLKELMQVITQDGIYGKIIKVGERTATLQTIFDYNFRVSGMNIRNGIQGIVRWSGGEGLVFEYIPIGSDIKIGDEIITSGIGGVFMKGLRVGTVKKIEVDKTGLTYHILLEPACKIRKIENVFVIKEIKSQKNTKKLNLGIWEIEENRPQKEKYIEEKENIKPQFEPTAPDIRK